MKNYDAVLVLWVVLSVSNKVLRLCALLIFVLCLASQWYINVDIIKPAWKFIRELIPALLAGEIVAFVILTILVVMLWIALKSKRTLFRLLKLTKLALH
jgi:hypothetical protein